MPPHDGSVDEAVDAFWEDGARPAEGLYTGRRSGYFSGDSCARRLAAVV